ncbi:hypothetical protein EGR_05432 [Echinococcus granulosus]|uniref:Uncharacterized protein n=1 Tax=Echinococcus granulosus TaxID=6210 RepID=W6UE29_ECHGR|nr:hypothetical protein EGR_05432 [Echinococcus granulosus]EUB59670.1 hypothetical protein EGR_05432 [Echinococcus granulosus]
MFEHCFPDRRRPTPAKIGSEFLPFLGYGTSPEPDTCCMTKLNSVWMTFPTNPFAPFRCPTKIPADFGGLFCSSIALLKDMKNNAAAMHREEGTKPLYHLDIEYLVVTARRIKFTCMIYKTPLAIGSYDFFPLTSGAPPIRIKSLQEKDKISHYENSTFIRILRRDLGEKERLRSLLCPSKPHSYGGGVGMQHPELLECYLKEESGAFNDKVGIKCKECGESKQKAIEGEPKYTHCDLRFNTACTSGFKLSNFCYSKLQIKEDIIHPMSFISYFWSLTHFQSVRCIVSSNLLAQLSVLKPQYQSGRCSMS